METGAGVIGSGEVEKRPPAGGIGPLLQHLLPNFRMNVIGLDIVPVDFHAEAGTLRNQHMAGRVDIFQFVREFGWIHRSLRSLHQGM